MVIRKKAHWEKTAQTKYLTHKLHLLFALLSAHLIIIHGERHTFKEIFSNPYYYICLAISTVIAYGIIAIVVRITRGLDFYYPWSRSFSRRFLRQLVFGITAPVLAAIFAATLYFAAYQIPIWKTVYFSRYLLPIIALLAALNGYLFYLWVSQNRNRKILRASFANVEPTLAADLYENVAYIFTTDKAYFSVSFTGEKLSWPYSISKSMAELPSQHFITLRQDIIVNRRAIAYVQVSKKGQVTVTLIEPLQKSILVSQRNQVNFKQWFQQPADLPVEKWTW